MSPVHDYVIDNSTGANVRADINNVLQAILTNNSSSSAPSTTAAYMWWADTTNGVLKIRNSANNDWVELLQLDGTLTLEDGSASTPALAFRDDLNTGIFSSAADTFNVATGGVERMELGATTIFNESGADVDFRIEGDTEANLFYVDAGNNNIGIGTASPTAELDIERATGTVEVQLQSRDSSDCFISFGDNSDSDIGIIKYAHSDDSMRFTTSTNERMRLDSSGRLLLNKTTSTSSNGNSILQVASTSNERTIAVHNFENDADGPYISLGKSRGTSVNSYTIVQDDDELGNIDFFGADGTDFSTVGARIQAEVDGTPGVNDLPGRLVFGTTADGANSPTERMRLDSSGRLFVNGTDANAVHSNADDVIIGNTSASLMGVSIVTSTSGYATLQFADGGGNKNQGQIAYNHSNDSMIFTTAESSRMTLDAGGRMLLGHSSARAVAGNTNRIFQIENGTSDIAGVSIVRNAASSGGPFISFGKSRSDSVGSNTIVQDGDTLGTISFAGADGTDLESRGADIFGQVDGTPGANDMPGRLIFSTTPDGSVSPTEAMRIDKDGNVSIGAGGDVTISDEGGGDGTVGTVISKSSGFQTKAINHHTAELNRAGTQGGTLLFFQNGTQVGDISVTSSATAYNTSSDYRLKENATAISDGITRLKTLKPYRFNFKADTSKVVDGFFAHEVTAVPEAITGTKDEVVTQALIDAGEYKEGTLNNPIYQGIDQSKLVPLLVAAVQELITKVETLEAA